MISLLKKIYYLVYRFIKSDFIWVLHPRTKLPDTHLSAAVYGFIFSGFIIILGFYLSFLTGKDVFVKYLAEIVGLFYGPSILAYGFRSYTKTKFQNNKE